MSKSPLTEAIIITVLLFFATLIFGWVSTTHNPEMGINLMKLFEKEVVDQILGNNPFDISVRLFLNNIEACTMLFLGGAAFGILTIFILSLNGIVIGSIMAIIHTDRSWTFILTALLPHGFFEIPALIISGALGIMLAQSLILEWYREVDASVEAQKLARVFLLYVLPLVVMAAGVEAFITPVIIHLVA